MTPGILKLFRSGANCFEFPDGLFGTCSNADKQVVNARLTGSSDVWVGKCDRICWSCCWNGRRSNDVEDSLRRQLREWFGGFVDSWRLLKRYCMSYALPSQSAHCQNGLPSPASLFDGLYDYRESSETDSIRGAMIRGRGTVHVLIADLSVSLR